MKQYSGLVTALVMILALAVSACQPIMVQTTVGVEPDVPRPDAPSYAMRGAHAVGTRDFVIQDGDEPVYLTVWYPALNPNNLKEEIIYDLSDGQTSMYQIPASPITDMSIVTIKGHAIRDAAPDVAQGPYPLVVFSEGLASWRHWHAYLVEHLASRGFVVVSSDPREVFETFWTGAATRPLDTMSIINYADALTAADGALAGLIDTEHIAVTGHSSGGWAALMGGGAQFDFSWCAANPDFLEEHFINNCDRFVPNQGEIAEMLGLDAVPTGLWPPVYDPRVDAVVAFAPDGDIWGANFEGVASMEVPTLLMVGTADLFAFTTAQPIYEHLGSEKKGLIVFENADHMIFITQCEDIPWIVDTSGYWFCADAVWDMDRTHDLTKHLTTAFMLAELKGDADAAAALAPENVTFPGITYETTAYALPNESTEVVDDSMTKTVTEFEAIDVACADGNVVLTDNPFLAGNSEIVEVNQEPGETYFTSKVVFYPEAYPGATLVAPGEGIDTPDGGFFVIHRGYGTGTLEGTEILLIATSGEGLADLPCEPEGPVAKLKGVIIHPEAATDVAMDSAMIVTEFESIDVTCVNGDEITLSDEPLVIGPYEILEVIQAPGEQYFQGTVATYPTAYPDGTWVAPGEGFDRPDGSFIALHHGYGTGSLEGTQFIYVAEMVEGLVDLPCEPDGPVVTSDGFIIQPKQLEAAALDPVLVAKIESIVQTRMDESQAPGMAICVVKDGQIVYSQGFGVAELGTDRLVTPQTAFNAASVTKTFTAAAIMQLVERGLVDLDAPVTEYLPWFSMADDAYREITVRQVMAHRAGIPPIEDMVEPVYLSWGFDKPETDDQAMQRRVQSLSAEQLIFAPDEDWSYTDWGFTILGTIVAEVSGQTYEDYIKEHLLQPLGMDNSGLMPSDIDPDLLASPHVHSESGEVMVSPVFPYSRTDAPAANLLVSCEDLATWALTSLNRGELNGTRVLQPESFETMWEQVSATGIDEFLGPHYGPSMMGYGLGHFVGSVDGHRLAGHAGLNPGFDAKIVYAPDDGLAVVALANWMPGFGPLFPADDAAVDVLYELLGVTIEEIAD